MTDALLKTLKQLRLSGLAQSLDIRLHEAHSHGLSHAEFLELLLQDELLVRRDRQLQRRLKAAQFREVKTFDAFDWSFNPGLPRKAILELATCRFLREGRDVLLLGPPGVGKSHVAQALGYQAIKQNSTVLYRSVFDVVRDFLHDEAFAGHDKVLARYLKPDLLIIDDMGMKQLPRRSGECLFEIVLRRYETRSTIMTSNRPLEDWGKLLGDVPSATAILDRFLHHAEMVTMQGKSYRLRHQNGSGKALEEKGPEEKALEGKASEGKTLEGKAPEGKALEEEKAAKESKASRRASKTSPA